MRKKNRPQRRPVSSELDFIGISEYLKCRKGFNFTPSMKALLKRNVPIFAATLREQLNLSQDCSSYLPSGSAFGFDGGNQEVDSSIFSKFRDLNLDENSEQGRGQEDETILNLIDRIEDLQRQVKERKDWARQKAMQAARKVSNDLAELNMLRMEREETQRLNKGKHVMGETTMKKFIDMEVALRKASGQLDRAKLAVKKRENENAEIRAEIEACRLSASEYETKRLEVLKREKKCLKKLGALEKQKNKLQDNIVAEKQKISGLQQQLVEVETANKEDEVKWRQEQRAKEQASALLKEELHLKEEVNATNKRRLEGLRFSFEIDFLRQKDDLQRLEQELTQLKASNELPEGDAARVLHDFDRLEVSSEKDVRGDRRCVVCREGEVSVVLLPCAHQVLCANCNADYRKKQSPICPYCGVPIDWRIPIVGAT